MKLPHFVFLLSITIPTLSFASGGIVLAPTNTLPVLGYPSVAGSGCPSGNVQIVALDSNGLLSINPTSFAVEGKQGFERKTCIVAIPVTVPRRKSLEMQVVGIQGAVDATRGHARVGAEFFLSGGQAPRLSQTYQGVKEDFFINGTQFWRTACGASTLIRINADAVTNGEASAVVDHMFARLRLVDCKTPRRPHRSSL